MDVESIRKLKEQMDENNSFFFHPGLIKMNQKQQEFPLDPKNANLLTNFGD